MRRMPDTDYYQVLGLPPDAQQDAIRQRFRELARRYHPDVNREPGAETRFKEIAEAYRVLSQAESRREYDNMRAEAEIRRRAAQRQRAAAADAVRNTAHGSAATRNRPAGARSAERAAQANAANSAVQASLRDAQVYFVQGKYDDARRCANQAIRMDASNARAWEILGDIAWRQNDPARAGQLYSYAIQHDPRSAVLRQKFEAVMGDHSLASWKVYPINRAQLLQWAGWTMVSLCVVTPLVFGWQPHPIWTAGGEPVAAFSLMTISSLLSGLLMSLSGGLQPFSREVWWLNGRSSKRPTGGLLALLGVLLFPAMVACHLGAGLFLRREPNTLHRAALAVVVLNCCFIITYFEVYHPALRMLAEVMIVRPGLSWLALIAGWTIGDTLRG